LRNQKFAPKALDRSGPSKRRRHGRLRAMSHTQQSANDHPIMVTVPIGTGPLSCEKIPLLARLERQGVMDGLLIAVAVGQWLTLQRWPKGFQIQAVAGWLLLPALASWILLTLGAIAPLTRRCAKRRGDLPRETPLWMAAYGLMALAWLVILFNINSEGLWGFWHMLRLSFGEFALMASFGPLLLAPGWRRLGRAARLGWRRRLRRIGGPPVANRLWTWGRWGGLVLLLGLYSWALADRSPMSDGWGMIGMAQHRSALTHYSYREPLSLILLREGHHWLKGLGLNAGASIGVINFGASLAMLAFIAWLIKGWGWTRRQREIAAWIIFSSLGITQMLLGRVELYAMVQLGVVATLATGLMAIEGRGRLWFSAMALIFALALGAHLSVVFILPAVGLMIWYWERSAPDDPQRSVGRGVVQLAAWGALVHLPLWTWLMFQLDEPTPLELVRAVTGSLQIGGEGRTFIGSDEENLATQLGLIFHPANGFKMVQILHYLAGGAALAGLLIVLARPLGRWSGVGRLSPETSTAYHRQMTVLWTAWIGYALYAFIWHADWAWSEDWDLFSALAPLSVLLVIRWLMPGPGLWRLPPRLARQVCLFALVLSLTQHYYYHTRATFLNAMGKISWDTQNGLTLQRYQMEHGWRRGEFFQIKEGRIELWKTGLPSRMIRIITPEDPLPGERSER
jgi:hypothetical protein